MALLKCFNKLCCLLVFLNLFKVTNLLAQENPVNTGFGLGFQLNQYQRDFGMGLNVTSPHFLSEKMAIRFRGNFMYFEHPENDAITWTPYSNVTLGIIGVGGLINERIKLYGEGGTIALFPSEDFSNKGLVIGGYGLFGFEFFMQKGFNYFIEIGGIGTGAKADKIALKPIYSNGLSISTGFRAYLK